MHFRDFTKKIEDIIAECHCYTSEHIEISNISDRVIKEICIYFSDKQKNISVDNYIDVSDIKGIKF